MFPMACFVVVEYYSGSKDLSTLCHESSFY